MKPKSQFFASVKREWLEITRTRKLFLYLAITIGTLILNLVFQYFSPQSFLNAAEIGTSSWYASVVQYNQLILNVYMIVCLFILKNNLTSEIAERKMVLPFSMGLSPKAYIGAKYLLQILVPSLIAAIGSASNGALSILFFENFSLIIPDVGIISITALDIFFSSICVYFIAILFLAVMFALSTLLKNANLSFILTVVLLLFGDPMVETLKIGVFTPNLLFSYAISMIHSASVSEFVISTLVTTSIIALLCATSILVFSDKYEK